MQLDWRYDDQERSNMYIIEHAETYRLLMQSSTRKMWTDKIDKALKFRDKQAAYLVVQKLYEENRGPRRMPKIVEL